MYVSITLIICLSVVFVITLGIVSCTLRDKNFKARSIFNSSDEQLANIELNDHYRHPDHPGTMYFICKEYLGKDGKQLPQEELDKIINNNLNS